MGFMLRTHLTQEEVDEIYSWGEYDRFFSINLHHGGKFSRFSGRKYVNGKINYVDLLDAERFSVHDLDGVLKLLGYDNADQPRYYHYQIPGGDLDFGLRALGSDEDVRLFVSHIPQVRVVNVYVEMYVSNVESYFCTPSKIKIEELGNVVDMPESSGLKTPPRLLLLEWRDDLTLERESETVHMHGDGDVIDDRFQTKLDGSVGSSGKGSDGQPGSSMFDNPDVVDLNGLQSSQHTEFVIDGQITLDDPLFDDIFNDNTDSQNLSTEQHSNVDYTDLDLNELPSNWTNFVCEALEVDDHDAGVNQTGVDNLEVNVDDDKTSEGSDEGSELEDDSDFEADVGNELDDVDMSDYQVNVDVVDEMEYVEEEVELNNQVLDSGSESDDCGSSVKKRTLRYLQNENSMGATFYIGQVFATKSEVKEIVREHAVQTRRQLKLVKDDKERVRVVCCGTIPSFDEVDGNGVSKKGKNVVDSSQSKSCEARGKISAVQNQCPWVLLVSKDITSGSWLVKTLRQEHKCVQSRSIKACTASFLSKKLVDQIAENPTIPVRAVQEQFQRQYEVHVSRMKAFRAKTAAMVKVDGDYTAQYALLRDYAEELVRANPGTTVKIEVESCPNPSSNERQFKRIYICLGGLKAGFKALGRDLLGLDGAFVKGPYPGQVLSAVGIDSNNGIYPVAYALVEAETMNSWCWFLDCLGDDLDIGHNSKFTFITDRQKGLIPAISKVFPSAEHRFCLGHIHENMKLTFRGKVYKDALWKLATCNTQVKFERSMLELKETNRKAYEWISKIPAKHWSRSQFSGRAVSDVLLNNMCEVFNSKILVGREKPIVTLLEYIREYLMRRIVNVISVIEKCESLLTPYATKIFEQTKREAAKYTTTWNGEDHYQANGPWGDQVVVNMRELTCACRSWEVSGLPCRHAVAAIWSKAAHGEFVGSPESFVHKVYRLETWKSVYKHKVYPLNGEDMWPKSQVPTTLTPPKYHKPTGRPKKARKRAAFEGDDASSHGKITRKGGSTTCGKCGKKGHNSRSCKGQGGN